MGCSCSGGGTINQGMCTDVIVVGVPLVMKVYCPSGPTTGSCRKDFVEY